MPAPGCLVALMAPIVVVLVVAAVLMVMNYRQGNANEQHKSEALRKTAAQARSYARDVGAAAHDLPGREAVSDIAERHDGKLISYTRAGDSLATGVRFFGEYEDTSMFGVSYSRAYQCYSIVFRRGTEGDRQATTTPLKTCHV